MAEPEGLFFFRALDSLFLSGSSPSFLGLSALAFASILGGVMLGRLFVLLLDPFLGGSRSMVSFEDVSEGKRSEKSFFRSFDHEENGDEELDEYFHQPEKKRRLTPDQVQFLERSFEVENKLEPERKIQLAKELGLQPRQVAIWFQNRRARWKTKQLEKDYEALQSSFNKLLLKQTEKGSSESSNTNQQSQAPLNAPIADSGSEGEVSKISIQACKQEDLSSTKSDVLDSESPCYIDGDHSSFLEPGDSSYVFEPDQSDLSQDEEDNLSKSLMHPPTYVFPKIEDVDYPNPSANSGCFGFPVEDQTFGFWSY
ncbi:unnamed protein product [Thlaspi arvense]|uniref:Homeobox-leucine zipper protein n=1 Tax=Thlaspi arvense TaxID=13288 RepID=A0AAU9RF53_THLAR|nr:unnamed protein product [Thlaspi arvense]